MITCLSIAALNSMEGVYLIRDRETGLHKIGMTTNWKSRQSQLQVGKTTVSVRFVQCSEARKWEKVLHSMFKHKRLPQSEWFRITEEEALPKINWLAEQTKQPMVVGKWKQAADGHYYRRRMSTSGNWYTEQKSKLELNAIKEQLLNSRINQVERIAISKARSEPGYWPTNESPNKVEWQSSDPTKRSESGSGCGSFLFFSIIIIGCSILAFNSDKSPPSDDSTITPRSELVPKPPVAPTLPKEPLRVFDTPNSLEIESAEEEDNQTEDEVDQTEGLDNQTDDNESDTSEGPQSPMEPIRNDMMLPINVSGSLEDICVNATSIVLRKIINQGIEVQPANRTYSYPVQGTGQRRYPTIYAIGLESSNPDSEPSPQATSLLSDTRLLYQLSRLILDNCDGYSSVEFGLWSTDKWKKFSK